MGEEIFWQDNRGDHLYKLLGWTGWTMAILEMGKWIHDPLGRRTSCVTEHVGSDCLTGACVVGRKHLAKGKGTSLSCSIVGTERRLSVFHREQLQMGWELLQLTSPEPGMGHSSTKSTGRKLGED